MIRHSITKPLYKDKVRLFSEEKINYLLYGYSHDYKELIINIFEIVLLEAIACKLVKRNIQDLSISTAELNEIYLMFENKNIEKYVSLFELQNNINDEISSFSHGMKQKVALIAALSHNPKVLIMDEPFVGLDPKAVFDMKGIMREMCEVGNMEEVKGDESLEKVFLELDEENFDKGK